MNNKIYLPIKFNNIFRDNLKSILLFESIFLLVLCLIIAIQLKPFAEDDAYIHYRIAENLAINQAPYFNQTEKVMATSSFVWTIFLAGLTFLKVPLPTSIAIMNPVLSVLGSLVWTLLLIRLVRKEISRALLICFQAVYVGALLVCTYGQMETPLSLLLLGLGVFLVTDNKAYGWLFFTLAVFTRYEIAIYALIFGMTWTFSKNPIIEKIKGYTYALIPFIVISTILLAFYSTIIPNTVAAKRVVYQLTTLQTAIKVFFSFFPSVNYPMFGFINSFESFQVEYFVFILGMWLTIIFSVLVISVFAYLFRKRTEKPNLTVNCLIIGGTSIAMLFVFLNVYVFSWYEPLFTVPILFGIFYHVSVITKKTAFSPSGNISSGSNFAKRLPIILLALLFSLEPLISLTQNSYASFFDIGKNQSAASGLRVQRYLEVGEVLFNTYPGAKLLTSEIGGLGYTFKGEIIDGMGLITPRALVYHPMSVPEQRQSGATGAIPAQMVGNENPELIVSYPGFVQEFDSSIYREEYFKIILPAFSQIWQEQTGIDNIRENYEIFIYIRDDLVKSEDIDLLMSQLGD